MLLRGNDGGRSSMVEPQIVILVVAGSSPVGHPDSWISTSPIETSNLRLNGCLRLTAILAGYEYWERADSESADCPLQGI